MATPASGQNEPSKMKKLMSGNMNDVIRARLPRANGVAVAPPPKSKRAPTASRPRPIFARLKLILSELKRRILSLKLLPAFWTVASTISILINVVLIAILLALYSQFKTVKTLGSYASNQGSVVLGGLYTNFLKMDQATISTTIPVDAMIPLNIVVPVQTTTQISLAESVVIPNAHVRITTGAMNINADAVVTLPANTPLVVRLDFPLTVQNSIPVHLDVPVNIPLNQTELHEPFVGLQEVVKPWYCLVERNATVNGLQVCPPARNPAPAGTAVP